MLIVIQCLELSRKIFLFFAAVGMTQHGRCERYKSLKILGVSHSTKEAVSKLQYTSYDEGKLFSFLILELTRNRFSA